MTTAMTEECNTSAIRVGDVIHHFCLRLKVDREIREVRSLYSDRGGTVWATSALIENWDQVADYVGDLADVDDSGRRRWTIQGNNFATWTREV